MTVQATVEYQRWFHDYALSMGSSRFDCEPVLDTHPLDDLPEDPDGDEWNRLLDYGDTVFEEAVAMRLTGDWDGPFECSVDGTEYDEYIARRKANGETDPVRSIRHATVSVELVFDADLPVNAVGERAAESEARALVAENIRVILGGLQPGDIHHIGHITFSRREKAADAAYGQTPGETASPSAE